MSPSLLSKRLKALETVGILERHTSRDSQAVEYSLTEAGKELWPVVEAMGIWGQRWARGDVRARHMDASLLMWDIHRNIVVEDLPERRVVVHFHLRGSSDKKSRFWLVLDRDTADPCLVDPGYDIDVNVESHMRTMVDYWMGHTQFSDVVRSGELVITGPRDLVRALPTWFSRSVFAPYG